MTITAEERAWLDAYRQELADRFPGLINEILIFGSKARGDAGPDSDLDVLVIVREGDRNTKREVRHIGHRLAVATDVVPSIMVYSQEEWSRRERGGSPFYHAVTRDRVHVA